MVRSNTYDLNQFITGLTNSIVVDSSNEEGVAATCCQASDVDRSSICVLRAIIDELIVALAVLTHVESIALHRQILACQGSPVYVD